MERRRLKWIQGLLWSVALLSAAGCGDDEAATAKGDVEFEITDAPSDDANIKGVFVTVAEVQVNGRAIEGFAKQTIDLKAYQQGSTKFLGNAKLDARSYSNIVLVLDLDQDANGNSPGCYVLTQDNTKFKLKSSSTGKANILVNQTWKVSGNQTNKIVLDFDLRKSIRYSDDASVRYSFVADENLNGAVRIISREKSGSVKGTYEEQSAVDADKIIVYAYKKGTFNASTETQGQGSDNIYFKNAVTSAEVKESLGGKVFTLAFLEEGEYELVFTGYNESSEPGRYNYGSRLQSETNADGQIGNIIKIQAGVSINISSSIQGVI